MPIIIYCLVKESIFAKVTFCKSFVAMLINYCNLGANWFNQRFVLPTVAIIPDECLLFLSAVLFHSTVVCLRLIQKFNTKFLHQAWYY